MGEARCNDLNWCCVKCHSANYRSTQKVVVEAVEMEQLAKDHYEAEVAAAQQRVDTRRRTRAQYTQYRSTPARDVERRV